MLRFHQVDKIAYDLYAQGYPPADVKAVWCVMNAFGIQQGRRDSGSPLRGVTLGGFNARVRHKIRNCDQ